MGYKDKKYRKSLYEQANDKLVSMQAFGESKKEAKLNGTDADKIFSFNSYKTYWKHTKYFLNWIKINHPEITTLKKARKYCNEWLQSRVDEGLSAWTIQTESMALAKLYGRKPTDDDWFEAPKRNRTDIKRSRTTTVRDSHFSVTNNDELIKFCRGTGCRRNILLKLNKDDLWTKERVDAELQRLSGKGTLTEDELKILKCLKDVKECYPDFDYYIIHRKDKGGRYRVAPVIDNVDLIVDRFERTPDGKKVWEYVNTNADIHGYRSDYATALYKKYARNIEDLPWAIRENGRRYRPDLYVCRSDEKGKKLDKQAMRICSKALGHNRISVVADNYIRGL